MKPQWMFMAFLVFASFLFTSSTPKKEDPSAPCVFECIKSAPHRIIWDEGTKPMGGIGDSCSWYSSVETCIQQCSDGKRKSDTTEILAKALKSCSSDSIREDIRNILSCVSSGNMRELERQCIMRENTTHNEHERKERDDPMNQCANNTFSRDCEFHKCFDENIEQYVATKCQKAVATFSNMMAPYQRLDVAQRFYACNYPEEKIPVACQYILSGGGNSVKASVMAITTVISFVITTVF